MNLPDSPPEEISRAQRWFQAIITHPDGVEAGANSVEAQQLINLSPDRIEQVICRSPTLSAVECLAIYANAYQTRLIECVGEVFPMLKRMLGEETFNGFAFGYIQNYPPRTYTLNELGRHFPRYLQETRPVPDDTELGSARADESDAQPALVESWPDFLIDLARLEWAIYEVFDGPGVEGQKLLSADDLLEISPEDWPRAQIQPLSCLQLLATRFPVNDYYTELRKAKGGNAVPISAACESFIALTRRDYVVRRYNLSGTEFELLRAICQGQTIGEAIERTALTGNEELDQLAANLKRWFRKWTAEGFFTSVRVIPQ